MNRQNPVLTLSSAKLAVLYLLFLPFIYSCSATSPGKFDPPLYYETGPASLASQSHSPVFKVEKPAQEYNRIGTPRVIEPVDGKMTTLVDPGFPSVYFEEQTFESNSNTFKNLIYRIHFQKVPFGLDNLNIAAGNNPGLLVIYTLNSRGEVILLTTVHTCGCYLAFFPTSAMLINSYPTNWPVDKQWVYGITLPARLPAIDSENQRAIVTIKAGTHRIGGVTIANNWPTVPKHQMREMKLLPLSALHTLPAKNGSVSFFETEGSRRGYVKNNIKILERLFISWWAFDLYVGEDKAFGTDDNSNNQFYTSLKFWQRDNSDMKNFPRFLRYWGWKL